MVFIIASSLISLSAMAQFNNILLSKQEVVASPTDPDYLSVVLLLHMDGANDGTTFTDNSSNPKMPTVFGNAKTVTTQYKFSPASAFFDGNGDYLSYATNSNFLFGTTNFTMEGWIYFVSNPSGVLFAIINSSGGSTGGVLCYVSAAGTLRLYGPSVSGNVATTFNNNTWYHIAVTRSSNTWTLWKNGVSQGSMTDAAACNTSTTMPLCIGGYGGGAYLNGYIDDIRITKGLARYTSNFTPPTTAFPNN